MTTSLHRLISFAVVMLCFITTGRLFAADSAPPHIVLFISDDHGVEDCGPYGNTVVRTPNLDRLAKESMRFTRAFAGSPTCVPSRNVIYTGLMPWRNGAHANHSETKAGLRSLPHYLREAGYRVALAGKVHVKPKEVFDFEYVPQTQMREPGTTGGLHQDLNAESVVRFIDEVDRDKPLCLVVASHSPHVVWPEKHSYSASTIDIPVGHVDTPDTRIARARYYEDITRMDTRLGHVMDAVERRGMAGNTVFIYTSDQGPQWPFAKWNLYDAGIRVPLLIRWPGRVKPLSVSDAMVSQVDFLATFMEIAGLTPAPGLDSRSFLSVLQGKANSHREMIFAAHTGDGRMNRTPMRCVRTDRFKYILNLAPQITYTTHIDKATDHDGGREYFPSWTKAARTDPEAARIVFRYHNRPAEELYDVLADPHEQRNLIADPAHAATLRELRSELAAWRKQQGEDIQAQ